MKIAKVGNESFNNKKLYKYRSLTNFKNFVDIIVNNRLYAANYKDLNDPMEGRFYYNSNEHGKRLIEEIKSDKSRFKICSLSELPNIGLLWSHYADSCRGVVIELEVLQGNNPEKVKYTNKLITINNKTKAEKILKTKLNAWSYEREYRVLSLNPTVPIKIHKIILGSNMEPDLRDLVKLLISKLKEPIPCEDIQDSDYLY